MAGAQEINFFDDEDTDKLVRIMREFDRTRGDTPVPEDYRAYALPVAVRITGPKDATLGMYPARFVTWKPGPLDTAAAPPGASAGVTAAVEEYDTHWYAEKNPDGLVANDCWLVMSSTELGGLAADPTGVIVDAKLVGEVPATGVPVALRSHRPPTSGSGTASGGSSGSSASPANDAPTVSSFCFTTDARTGLVTGGYVVYQDPSTRDEVCVQAPACPAAAGCGTSSGSGSGGGGGAPACVVACLTDIAAALAALPTGESVLAATVSLSATSGTPTVLTGLGFTAPSAGTYLVALALRGVSWTTGGNSQVVGRLLVGGAAVANAELQAVYMGPANAIGQATGTRSYRLTLAAGAVVTVDARHDYTGTLYAGGVYSDTNGRSSLTWQKVPA